MCHEIAGRYHERAIRCPEGCRDVVEVIPFHADVFSHPAAEEEFSNGQTGLDP